LNYRNRWDSGRFEDPTEAVARQGDPNSWGVLSAAVSRKSKDVGQARRNESRSRTTTSTSRDGLEGVVTKARERVKSVTQSEILAEEPESYASTTDHVEGDSEDELNQNDDPNAVSLGIHDDEESTTSEEDSDSDDEDELDKPLLRKPRSSSHLRTPSLYERSVARIFPLSITAKNVLKCVLAYFIASLFTFIPVLSDFVGAPWDVDGPVRNAHAIATTAVYFMPSRTIGKQLPSPNRGRHI